MIDLFSIEMMEKAVINIAPGELNPDDIRAYAEKHDGAWTASAWIDTDKSRVMLAFSHGKKRNMVLRDVLTKAVRRVEKGT